LITAQPNAFHGHAWLLVGVFLWTVIAVGSVIGLLPLDTIEVLFLLAPLVTMPLALRLLQHNLSGRAPLLPERLQSVLGLPSALLVVVSLFTSAGWRAAALCAPWALFAGLTALAAVLRTVVREKSWRFHQLGFLAAQLYLPIGASWLILSRLGATPMGFAEPIVLLTAVHFHFAGFAAPVIAGETCRRAADEFGRIPSILRLATGGIVVAPALIATGFVFSKTLQMLSVFLSSVSLVLLAASVFRLLPQISSRFARFLLRVSAGTVPAGMVFATVYAIGMFQDQLFVSIPRMAVIHGLLNGLGFSLCGLWAWNLRAQAERYTR
jgi:hypothetical protein